MPAKHLAQIILPETDNDGNSLAAIHSDLKFGLATTFGGYTSIAATGAWMAPNGHLYDEDVIVYYVAMENNDLSRSKLEGLAAAVALRAGQEAVAIVLPNGEFETIEPAFAKPKTIEHLPFPGSGSEWDEPEHFEAAE